MLTDGPYAIVLIVLLQDVSIYIIDEQCGNLCTEILLNLVSIINTILNRDIASIERQILLDQTFRSNK